MPCPPQHITQAGCLRQRLAERKRRKERGEKDEDEIDINEELAGKYKFVLTGREPVNGRPAYVLSFEPRSGDLPVQRRMDRLLNKAAGRILIKSLPVKIQQQNSDFRSIAPEGGRPDSSQQ